MLQRSVVFRSAVLSFGICCAISMRASAAPIVLPYAETFDSYAVGNTAVNNFTESNTAAYTIVNNGVSGDNQYHASISSASGAGNGSAGVQITNAVGNAFHIQTDIIVRTFTAPTGSTTNLGLGLFGDTADFSAGNQYRLLYTTANPTAGNIGKLTLTKTSGSGLGGTLSSTSAIAVAVGAILTLSADISYTGSTLNINGSLTDGVNTITLAATDTSPLVGQFFGYRTAVNAAGGTATEAADYDNFSVVPEPGATSVIMAVGLFAFGRRARRSL